MQQESIFEKIRENYSSLPKQQKVIADFILNSYGELVFLSAKGLSDKIGVSSATIVRFAQSLGYDGYPDLVKELKQVFFKENSPMAKLKESFAGPSDPYNVFKSVTELDQKNISFLEKQISGEVLNKAIDMLLHSQRVKIIGGRTSFSLVYYSGFLFRQLDNKFDFLNSSSDDAIERLSELGDKDCIFAISFHRYFKRTSELVSYCAKKGIPILSLTDDMRSPLLPNSSLVLFAPNHAPFYSFVPAMTIVNTLIAAFAKALNRSAKDIFEKRTQELLENDIYV